MKFLILLGLLLLSGCKHEGDNCGVAFDYNHNSYQPSDDNAVIPEPLTLSLLGLGALGLAMRKKL